MQSGSAVRRGAGLPRGPGAASLIAPPSGYQWPWMPQAEVVTPCSFMAIGKHSFAPEMAGELAFAKGEQIYVIARADSSYPRGWLVARNNRGEQGVVPEGFLTHTAELPGKKLTARTLAKAVEGLLAELQQWEPDAPLYEAQGAAFAQRLRDLADLADSGRALAPTGTGTSTVTGSGDVAGATEGRSGRGAVEVAFEPDFGPSPLAIDERVSPELGVRTD